MSRGSGSPAGAPTRSFFQCAPASDAAASCAASISAARFAASLPCFCTSLKPVNAVSPWALGRFFLPPNHSVANFFSIGANFFHGAIKASTMPYASKAAYRGMRSTCMSKSMSHSATPWVRFDGEKQ